MSGSASHAVEDAHKDIKSSRNKHTHDKVAWVSEDSGGPVASISERALFAFQTNGGEKQHDEVGGEEDDNEKGRASKQGTSG